MKAISCSSAGLLLVLVVLAVLAAGCMTHPRDAGSSANAFSVLRASREQGAGSNPDNEQGRSGEATPALLPASLAHHGWAVEGASWGELKEAEARVQNQDADAAEAARKLANPLSDIWALFTEFDMTFSNGSAVRGGGDKFGFNAIFQPVMPLPLTENYNLITRPTLPIAFSEAIPEPGGGFRRKGVGLGDLALPLLVADKHGYEMDDGSLLFGVGPTFGFPTGTNRFYSSKTYEIGPAAVLVYKTKNITAGVFPQYWWSYADRSGDQPSTSHGNLLYFFFYDLPEAWQIGTNPTITYNHMADHDDAYNVPVGLTVAKTVKFGKRIVKFQLGIEYSVVNQDTYGKEVLIKFNVIPVVASLFQEPIF